MLSFDPYTIMSVGNVSLSRTYSLIFSFLEFDPHVPVWIKFFLKRPGYLNRKTIFSLLLQSFEPAQNVQLMSEYSSPMVSFRKTLRLCLERSFQVNFRGININTTKYNQTGMFSQSSPAVSTLQTLGGH